MKADKTGRESKLNFQKLKAQTFFLNIMLIEVVFDLPASNLGGTSSAMHPEQKITKKLVSQHTIILVTTITEILSSVIVFIK